MICARAAAEKNTKSAAVQINKIKKIIFGSEKND